MLCCVVYVHIKLSSFCFFILESTDPYQAPTLSTSHPSSVLVLQPPFPERRLAYRCFPHKINPFPFPHTGAIHRTLEAEQLCPTCPYFLPTPIEVTAPVGISANLTCGVRNLGDKKVRTEEEKKDECTCSWLCFSWMRTERIVRR